VVRRLLKEGWTLSNAALAALGLRLARHALVDS
jgi:hypothetical protein